ncbi:hypothetical protein B0H67DRAFT_561136 [Lasiosphaeris hirsuta]|uniref:Uncharacterized protein n=1 Tax=Lasiosphaeris hirsuta TaxID=260670 RepID=A0AA40B9V3_9PEZI|nr:hypothetical protein B0H67DRAFT_561136 [Lasiosphaeris hirsuta]
MEGHDGSMAEATLQSSYDGAALVYARSQALTYPGNSDPPGHASITTFTTNGTQLNFYAHYATPAGDGTLKYHQYPISSVNLAGTYQGHKDGRRRLRNAQDYAKTQSEELKDQLEERRPCPYQASNHWTLTRTKATRRSLNTSPSTSPRRLRTTTLPAAARSERPHPRKDLQAARPIIASTRVTGRRTP